MTNVIFVGAEGRVPKEPPTPAGRIFTTHRAIASYSGGSVGAIFKNRPRAKGVLMEFSGARPHIAIPSNLKYNVIAYL